MVEKKKRKISNLLQMLQEIDSIDEIIDNEDYDRHLK